MFNLYTITQGLVIKQFNASRSLLSVGSLEEITTRKSFDVHEKLRASTVDHKLQLINSQINVTDENIRQTVRLSFSEY